MKSFKEWVTSIILAGAILMFGYNCGTKFTLLGNLSITNIPFTLSFFFWTALGVMIIIKIVSAIRMHIEKKGKKIDTLQCIVSCAMLFNVGYIFSFMKCKILFGMTKEQLITIIVLVMLVAINYALRPYKKKRVAISSEELSEADFLEE